MDWQKMRERRIGGKKTCGGRANSEGSEGGTTNKTNYTNKSAMIRVIRFIRGSRPVLPLPSFPRPYIPARSYFCRRNAATENTKNTEKSLRSLRSFAAIDIGRALCEGAPTHYAG